MYAEDEAKTRWCPMQREFEECNGGPVSITVPIHKMYSRCIASACMMWRWDRWDEKAQSSRGFCGFGGQS